MWPRRTSKHPGARRRRPRGLQQIVKPLRSPMGPSCARSVQTPTSHIGPASLALAESDADHQNRRHVALGEDDPTARDGWGACSSIEVPGRLRIWKRPGSRRQPAENRQAGARKRSEIRLARLEVIKPVAREVSAVCAVEAHERHVADDFDVLVVEGPGAKSRRRELKPALAAPEQAAELAAPLRSSRQLGLAEPIDAVSLKSNRT